MVRCEKEEEDLQMEINYYENGTMDIILSGPQRNNEGLFYREAIKMLVDELEAKPWEYRDIETREIGTQD